MSFVAMLLTALWSVVVSEPGRGRARRRQRTEDCWRSSTSTRKHWSFRMGFWYAIILGFRARALVERVVAVCRLVLRRTPLSLCLLEFACVAMHTAVFLALGAAHLHTRTNSASPAKPKRGCVCCCD